MFFLAFSIDAKAQNKQMYADVPTISYCELINNAEKYDQRFVRVRVTYSISFEQALFFDESCENVRVSWAEFIQASEDNTKAYLLKKLHRLIKRRRLDTPRKAELLIVGKFDGERQISILKTPVKTFTFSIGFGHMNSFDYQLTVLKIEEVKPVAN